MKITHKVFLEFSNFENTLENLSFLSKNTPRYQISQKSIKQEPE